MVAVTDTSPETTVTPVETGNQTPATPARSIGVVPTASMITGAAIARGVVLDSADHPDHRRLLHPVGHRIPARRRRLHLPDARRRLGRTRTQRGGVRPGHPVSRRARLSPYNGFQRWAAPAVAGRQQRPVLEGRRAPLPADDLRPAGHRDRVRVCWRSPSWARRPRSRSGRATTTPDCRSSRRRWPGCWPSSRSPPPSPSWSSRPSVDAADRPVAAVRRRRPPRCSTRSARWPTRGWARCRRRRPNGTASSAICTTACSRGWCRWP